MPLLFLSTESMTFQLGTLLFTKTTVGAISNSSWPIFFEKLLDEKDVNSKVKIKLIERKASLLRMCLDNNIFKSFDWLTRLVYQMYVILLHYQIFPQTFSNLAIIKK